jgi:hypothetical protein
LRENSSSNSGLIGAPKPDAKEESK